jgi:hypothetical protein
VIVIKYYKDMTNNILFIMIVITYYKDRTKILQNIVKT